MSSMQLRRNKPDSSYASTQLTKKPRPEPKPEPKTDDEPMSSSEDEAETIAERNTDSETETKARPQGPSLQEKLAKSSQEGGDGSQSARAKGAEPRSSNSQGAGRKRKSEVVRSSFKYESDEDEAPFSSMFSSQSSKKRKTGYASRRKSEPFGKAPSSSMASPRSSSPPASERKPKSKSKLKTSKNSPGSKAEEKAESKKDGFKVPMDIDIPSPVSKGPEFKHPPSFPNDTISSSSFITSSAREPQPFDIDDNDSSDTPLSSAPSEFLDELSKLEGNLIVAQRDAEETLESEQSLCPMCKEAVDPELLMRFQSQPKQRIRDQQRFCESHKEGAAAEEWQQKGYPTIDWDSFDDRIQDHFDDLENLLTADSSSYFRNILVTSLKSGKAKNFRLTLDGDGLETISCGYYGTRGAGKMLNALTTRFSRKLRRLAASDNIVKTAGVVPYAQAVLVPELAVRLVKEDMGVNDDTARQILRDSIDIGEKLNPAPNDKVPIPVEDDENNMQA